MLGPDIDEISSAVKRYSQQGNKEASTIEHSKLKSLKREHGVYPMVSMLNIVQMPVHMVYISIINRLSYNFDINPAILSDGILWFQDLSSPDPWGILPVAGGLMSLLNILTNSNTASSAKMRKYSKYLKVFPLISIPIWMTFPAAFNIYWLISASTQLIISNAFRSNKFRKYMGLSDFLPGTKLERLNKGHVGKVMKPKIYNKAQI